MDWTKVHNNLAFLQSRRACLRKELEDTEQAIKELRELVRNIIGKKNE